MVAITVTFDGEVSPYPPGHSQISVGSLIHKAGLQRRSLG